MGSFTNREIKPVDATMPLMPTGLHSVAQSGKSQFRAIQHVGRSWTETYGVIDPETVTGRAFLHEVHYLLRTGTVVNVLHPGYGALLGTGGGTPLVSGGSQVGSSIVTDGWPNSTIVLAVGDLIQFTGLPLVYDVTAQVTSNGSGEAAIPIDPPIFAGGAPADNAPLFVGSSISWKVRVVDVQPGTSSVNLLRKVTGLRVTLREAVV